MADLSQIELNGTTYDLKDATARQKLPWCIVNSNSTSTAFTATVTGITSLENGVCFICTNNKVGSTGNCTMNVNNLGAKAMYKTTGLADRITTEFQAGQTWIFVYNSSRVSSGCWDVFPSSYSVADWQKRIGNTSMGTTATTVTGAIAEHEGDISGINTTIGSTTMGTTATTLTGAIAEHEGDISGINTTIGNTSMGTTATTLTGAIAEHEGDISGINTTIGNTSMGTTATTLTGAIAEHESDIDDINTALGNEKNRVITLGSTTQIPDNSDFNTYTTLGNYYVGTTVSAQTMSNIPRRQAGRLFVMSCFIAGGSYLRQIYLPYYGGVIYTRLSENSGASWYTWYETAQVDYQICNNKENLATSSKAYSVGEFFVRNGELYQVTDAIAAGDTFSTSTNVTRLTATEAIKDLTDRLDDGIAHETCIYPATDSVDFDTENRFLTYFLASSVGSVTGTKPFNENGYLINFLRAQTQTRLQFAIPRNTNEPDIYMRKNVSGTWGSWMRPQGSGNPLKVSGNVTLTGSKTSWTNILSSSNAEITSSMVVLHYVYGTPSQVLSDVQWQTVDGNVQVKGTFGSTGSTVSFYLAEPRT